MFKVDDTVRYRRNPTQHGTIVHVVRAIDGEVCIVRWNSGVSAHHSCRDLILIGTKVKKERNLPRWMYAF